MKKLTVCVQYFDIIMLLYVLKHIWIMYTYQHHILVHLKYWCYIYIHEIFTNSKKENFMLFWIFYPLYNLHISFYLLPIQKRIQLQKKQIKNEFSSFSHSKNANLTFHVVVEELFLIEAIDLNVNFLSYIDRLIVAKFDEEFKSDFKLDKATFLRIFIVICTTNVL